MKKKPSNQYKDHFRQYQIEKSLEKKVKKDPLRNKKKRQIQMEPNVNDFLKVNKLGSDFDEIDQYTGQSNTSSQDDFERSRYSEQNNDDDDKYFWKEQRPKSISKSDIIVPGGECSDQMTTIEVDSSDCEKDLQIIAEYEDSNIGINIDQYYLNNNNIKLVNESKAVQQLAKFLMPYTCFRGLSKSNFTPNQIAFLLGEIDGLIRIGYSEDSSGQNCEWCATWGVDNWHFEQSKKTLQTKNKNSRFNKDIVEDDPNLEIIRLLIKQFVRRIFKMENRDKILNNMKVQNEWCVFRI